MTWRCPIISGDHGNITVKVLLFSFHPFQGVPHFLRQLFEFRKLTEEREDRRVITFDGDTNIYFHSRVLSTHTFIRARRAKVASQCSPS